MRELIKNYPKIVFRTFLVVFKAGGSVLGWKRCREGCPNVSGTNWKNSILKHWENDCFSTFSPIFPPVHPRNHALPPSLKLLF